MSNERDTFLTPEWVDEQIEQGIGGAPITPESRFLSEVQQAARQVRAEQEDSLSRVEARLKSHVLEWSETRPLALWELQEPPSVPHQGVSGGSFPPMHYQQSPNFHSVQEGSFPSIEYQTSPDAHRAWDDRPPIKDQRPPHPRKTRSGWRASLLVAVLVALILVGSMAVVLHTVYQGASGGTQNATATPSAVSWGRTLYTRTADEQFEGLAWSPDGQRVATLALTNIRIWDATTGGHALNIPIPGLPSASGLAWSPDGKWIAINDAETLLILDTQSGKFVRQYPLEAIGEAPAATQSPYLSTLQPQSGLGIYINGLAWSPDSSQLAVSISSVTPSSRSVEILNAQTGAPVYRLSESGSYDIQVTGWSSDGKYLAANAVNTEVANSVWIWAWDTSTHQIVFKQQIGNGDNIALWTSNKLSAWQPDSDNLAYVNTLRPDLGTQGVVVWDVAHNKQVRQYTAVATTGLLSWSPDGKYLAEALDNRITILDTQTGRQVYVYTQHSYHMVDALAWSPNGRYIASADMTEGSPGSVKIWTTA